MSEKKEINSDLSEVNQENMVECIKVYTQSANDFRLRNSAFSRCLKDISKKINSPHNTPETLQQAFQALCIIWHEVQQDSSMNPDEKKKACAQINAIINKGLNNPNNDETSLQIGNIALKKHILPYTSAIICKRIPHNDHAKFGMEIVNDIPSSDFSILVLGGDGTTKTASINGYLKAIETLLNNYYPSKVKPNLYGVAYDWGETYFPAFARELLAKNLNRFNKNCLNKKSMELQRSIFKNYIAWLLSRYLSTDKTIQNFLKSAPQNKIIQDFLLSNIHNKNIQTFLLKRVPEKYFKNIFPAKSGITDRISFLQFLSHPDQNKFKKLWGMKEIYFSQNIEKINQQTALLFLGYLEKMKSVQNTDISPTPAETFLKPYLKEEVIASFWLEALSEKNKKELRTDIQNLQIKKQAAETLSDDLIELLTHNQLSKKQLNLFFLQFLETADMKFFFLKNLNHPVVSAFLKENIAQSESENSPKLTPQKVMTFILNQSNHKSIYKFFEKQTHLPEVQKFLSDILKSKVTEKMLSSGKLPQALTNQNLENKFAAFNEYYHPRYVQQIFESTLLPRLMTPQGTRYKDMSRVCKNMRKITIIAHCHGANVFMQLEKLMQQKMLELGYTAEEREKIQKQLVCIAHEPYCPLGVSKSTLISFTSAQDTVVNYYNRLADGYALTQDIHAITHQIEKKNGLPLLYLNQNNEQTFITPFISDNCVDEHCFHTSNDIQKGYIKGSTAKKMTHLSGKILFNSLINASSGNLLQETDDLFQIVQPEEKKQKKITELPVNPLFRFEKAKERGELLFDTLVKRIQEISRFEDLLQKMAQKEEAEIQNCAFKQIIKESESVLKKLIQQHKEV